MSRLETSACKSPRISITTDEHRTDFFDFSNDRIVLQNRNSTSIGISSNNETDISSNETTSSKPQKRFSLRTPSKIPKPRGPSRSNSQFSMSSLRQSLSRTRQFGVSKNNKNITQKKPQVHSSNFTCKLYSKCTQ